MEDVLTLDENNSAETAELLIGRRIVEAAEGVFEVGRYDKAAGKLVLDNGTEIFVIPNQGGCACSAGDYELGKLATVDNAISNVELVVDEHDDYGNEKTYRIHVVADAEEMDVVTIHGDDGNGYYGTGYNLIVRVRNEVEAS